LVQEHAPELKLPVIVLQGGDDRIALPENSHRLFNSAGTEDKTYREYPEGYHEPHNDIDHEVVLSEVVDWLNGHI
jgi:alpha-beta hydrolase superfamily lysophospholipase